MTVSDILQLSAAGFSKAEILVMSNADTGKHEQKDEGAKPEEKTETVSADFAKALDAINKRLDALVQTKAEPEKKEEPKKDSTDVLALLQSMNMAGQRYDLPPKYNPDDALAGALDAVMNGEKKGDNK
jgi:hypothetical protein